MTSKELIKSEIAKAMATVDSVGKKHSAEVTEGRLVISWDNHNEWTIALDYDADHEEATGEIGISCTWPTFAEAEETFWQIWNDYWSQMNDEEERNRKNGQH